MVEAKDKDLENYKFERDSILDQLEYISLRLSLASNTNFFLVNGSSYARFLNELKAFSGIIEALSKERKSNNQILMDVSNLIQKMVLLSNGQIKDNRGNPSKTTDVKLGDKTITITSHYGINFSEGQESYSIKDVVNKIKEVSVNYSTYEKESREIISDFLDNISSMYSKLKELKHGNVPLTLEQISKFMVQSVLSVGYDLSKEYQWTRDKEKPMCDAILKFLSESGGKDFEDRAVFAEWKRAMVTQRHYELEVMTERYMNDILDIEECLSYEMYTQPKNEFAKCLLYGEIGSEKRKEWEKYIRRFSTRSVVPEQ